MNLDLMTKALEEPVSIDFEDAEMARAFRADCYRQRDAMRLVGVRDFDLLKFHIRRNVLTIVNKKIKIRGML